MVKDGIRNHYIDDVEQFPIAVKKLKELDDIFDNLSHDLRDALMSTCIHRSTKKKNCMSSPETRKLVDTFADYVEASPLLTAIDQKEFADVQIKAPLRRPCENWKKRSRNAALATSRLELGSNFSHRKGSDRLCRKPRCVRGS